MPGTPTEQLLARLRDLAAALDSARLFAASAGEDDLAKQLDQMRFVVDDHLQERQGDGEAAGAAL